MKLSGKNVFITGASAGIGYACAEVFAEAGANLILTARRKDKIDELAVKLKTTFNIKIHTAQCDVRNYEEVKDVVNNIHDGLNNIDILINNAGKAKGLNKLHEGELSDWEEMIDTNIKGLLYVSRLIIPGMAERKSGHVINIASIAGREVYPNGNVYCASKSAVRSLSQAMMIDLNGTDVRITNIDPGLVETEFALVRFHGDESRAQTVYQNYTPLTGRDIAETALFAASRPRHVCIQDILITPTDQATATLVHKTTDNK